MMKLSLWILLLSFFFLQTGVFSAENKENPESAKNTRTENKENSDAVKNTEQETGKKQENNTEAKSAAGVKTNAKKETKDTDDDEVEALKSWRNQACPDTKNWDRTNTSQARKSFKSTYKVHTDKDMRAAGLRLND